METAAGLPASRCQTTGQLGTIRRMNDSVVTRFAPSPTGRLHLGNARTALFNALFARGRGGAFLLRIEDTDAARGSRELEAGLLGELRWLGLISEEDPGRERQSERRELHDEHVRRLERDGLVYPCFCTDEDLKLARKAQVAAGKAPRYPGTCAAMSDAERRARLDEGRPHTMRFRVPEGRTVVFDDLVRGEQRFESDLLGDFVITRTDGSPAFFFANGLDDALMGVTHVLRGEDHVANTPRQLLLLEALGLEPPAYGHLPLVVGQDGAPLSKRRGAASLAELRERGYLPAAVTNYLARLGHHFDDDDLMSLDDLARGFSLGSLGRAPAHFDRNQLRHWQKLAVAAVSDEAFMDWAGEGVAVVPSDLRASFVSAVRPNCEFPSDVAHWAGILFGEELRLGGEAVDVVREAGNDFFQRAAEAVARDGASVETIKAATGEKGKRLFMPLRAALTGELHGPELKAILELLGTERVAERLAACGSKA